MKQIMSVKFGKPEAARKQKKSRNINVLTQSFGEQQIPKMWKEKWSNSLSNLQVKTLRLGIIFYFLFIVFQDTDTTLERYREAE